MMNFMRVNILEKSLIAGIAVFCALNFSPQSVMAGVFGKEEFLAARKAFSGGLYDLAAERFEIFIRDYPNTEYLYEARLLLGRSYFMQNKLKQALYQLESLTTSPSAITFHDEALFWMGEIALRSGDLRKAMAYYQNIIDSFSQSKYAPYAEYSKGWIYNIFSLYDEAIRSFARVALMCQEQNIAIESQFRIGECRYFAGEYLSAVEEFENFIKKYPLSKYTARAYYMRGESRYYLGQYARSAEDLRYALFVSRDGEWAIFARYRMAADLLELGLLNESLEEFKKCFDESRDIFLKDLSLSGMVQVNLKKEVFAEALSLCDTFLAVSGTSALLPEFCYFKIRALIGLERYDDSLALVNESLNRFENNHYSYEMKYCKAVILARKSFLDEALKEFLEVAEKSDDIDLSGAALCGIGDIYHEKRDNINAAAAYDNILRLYTDSASAPYAQYKIAEIYFLNERYDQAIPAYRMLLKNFSKSIYREEALFKTGSAYFLLGDYARSAIEFDNYIRSYPKGSFFKEALAGMISALYFAGNYEEAVKKLKGFEETQSDADLKAFLLFEEAILYFKTREDDEALKSLGKLIKLFPESHIVAEANFKLGQYYKSQGKYAEAEKYYNAVANGFYDDAIRKESLLQSGIMSFESGRAQDAMTKFGKIISLFPDGDGDRFIYRKMAAVSKASGKFEDAIKYFKLSMTDENNESNAQAQFEIAECVEKTDGMNASAAEYKKVEDFFSKGSFWVIRSQLKRSGTYKELVTIPAETEFRGQLSDKAVDDMDFSKERLDLFSRGVKQ